jgi:hypothetical protein
MTEDPLQKNQPYVINFQICGWLGHLVEKMCGRIPFLDGDRGHFVAGLMFFYRAWYRLFALEPPATQRVPVGGLWSGFDMLLCRGPRPTTPLHLSMEIPRCAPGAPDGATLKKIYIYLLGDIGYCAAGCGLRAFAVGLRI